MSALSKVLRRFFAPTKGGPPPVFGASVPVVQTVPPAPVEAARSAAPPTESHPQVFDRYVSLGCNCEVGFQLKRVRGGAESGFFTWNITEPAALISLLETDFAGILQKSNLSVHTGGHLVRDASHDFMVHHDFDPVAFMQAPDFDDKLTLLHEKFEHFLRKFRQSAAAPGNTAYFYKNNLDDPRGFALRVQELLGRYHGDTPFTLIVLQTEDRAEPDWGLPGIRNRYLKRFAPYDDTPDGHVPSWDAVFREFPHREPLTLVNY